MRVKSTQRQRRWNNILILGIVAFMVLLNAPKLIQTYLLSPPEESQETLAPDSLPKLLDPNHDVEALFFNGAEFEWEKGQWTSNLNIRDVPVSELITRWQELEGTLLEDDVFDAIRPNLGTPETIEVHYQGVEEPHRITFYRGDDFWVLQNWQQQWIAISFEVEYLIP
ncbi:hypothetical protein RCJ22_12295 [Vibrio sp. FNV 38]|nr:hypothetical protein [Vibrio sp. FNV 38]